MYSLRFSNSLSHASSRPPLLLVRLLERRAPFETVLNTMSTTQLFPNPFSASHRKRIHNEDSYAAASTFECPCFFVPSDSSTVCPSLVSSSSASEEEEDGELFSSGNEGSGMSDYVGSSMTSARSHPCARFRLRALSGTGGSLTMRNIDTTTPASDYLRLLPERSSAILKAESSPRPGLRDAGTSLRPSTAVVRLSDYADRMTPAGRRSRKPHRPPMKKIISHTSAAYSPLTFANPPTTALVKIVESSGPKKKSLLEILVDYFYKNPKRDNNFMEYSDLLLLFRMLFYNPLYTRVDNKSNTESTSNPISPCRSLSQTPSVGRREDVTWLACAVLIMMVLGLVTWHNHYTSSSICYDSWFNSFWILSTTYTTTSCSTTNDAIYPNNMRSCIKIYQSSSWRIENVALEFTGQSKICSAKGTLSETSSGTGGRDTLLAFSFSSFSTSPLPFSSASASSSLAIPEVASCGTSSEVTGGAAVDCTLENPFSGSPFSEEEPRVAMPVTGAWSAPSFAVWWFMLSGVFRALLFGAAALTGVKFRNVLALLV